MPAAEIGDRWQWRRISAARQLVSNLKDADDMLGRLMSAYVGAEKASVDLVACCT